MNTDLAFASVSLYGRQDVELAFRRRPVRERESLIRDSQLETVTKLYMESRSFKYDHKPAEIPFIYERDTKVISESERESGVWNPRIIALKEVYAEKDIYSISFVPHDETVSQTLYYKKRLYQEPMLQYTEAHGDYSGYEKGYYKTSYERGQEGTEILIGFVKPYNTFKSPYKSEIDPENCPNNVEQKTIETVQDVELALTSFSSPTLRKRMETILFAFLCDGPAKGLGITYLVPHDQARPVRQVVYLK